jgi:phage terminase large subunit-like protein
MGDALATSALTRWRNEPTSFIREVLRDPETGRAFQLFKAERDFFEHAWKIGDDGRLVYPEQVYGAIKKTGKSALGGMHLITTTLVFGGKFAEAYCVANDLEQAQSRVFLAVRRICEASPHLRRECEITQSRISFPQTNSSIQAIGADYAGAAGAAPCISSFDELWGYTSERSRRLWDEMVPVPTRRISCRLVTTYAGFSGESALLEELYKRGIALPEVAPSLHADPRNGMLLAWHHQPVAPWQTDSWIAEMRRSLRPAQFARMICNEWVTSETSFIEMRDWDACVDPFLCHVVSDRSLPVWVGVDASTKRDSTALAAVSWDKSRQQVRLVAHRIFQPSADRPLDFESSVEGTLLDWKSRFKIRQVYYDPYQMLGSAQRLQRAGVPMMEFPQSVPNLTAASQNLYDLIKGHNFITYADEQIRLAVSRAVAVEGPRGWKISKTTQSHKIDIVIALGLAAYGAVQQGGKPVMRTMVGACSGGADGPISWKDLATGKPIGEEEAQPRRVVLRSMKEDGTVIYEKRFS